MTLIVDALDRIARQCSVDTPTSWARGDGRRVSGDPG
jgi:hypothetical protein